MFDHKLNFEVIFITILSLVIITSSDPSINNKSQIEDLTLLSLPIQTDFTQTSALVTDNTSTNDFSKQDIDVTTFGTISSNNDSKSYFYNQSIDSKLDNNEEKQFDPQLNSVSSSFSSIYPIISSNISLNSSDISSRIETHSSSITSNPINSIHLTNQTTESGEKRRTNANPSMDDIISGILQLIGGNVKLPRPQNKLQPLGPFRPDLLSATRINNRGPPKVPLINPLGNQMPNVVPPNVLIGPGRPAGIALPFPPSQLSRLPLPLNIGPTKPPFNIPESDVSFLLGLIKPHIKDEKDMMVLKNLPKIQTTQSSDKIKDKTNSVINSRPIFTDKILANPSNIQDFIRANSYYSNIFSSLSSHLLEVSVSKTKPLTTLSTVESVNSTTDITDTLFSSFVIPSQPPIPLPTGPITDWVPVATSTSNTKTYESATDEPIIITMPEEPSVFEVVVKQQIGPKPSLSTTIDPTPVNTKVSNTLTHMSSESVLSTIITPTQTLNTSINSVLNNSLQNISKDDVEIVYGRPAHKTNYKTITSSFTSSSEDIITLLGSAEMSTTSKNTVTAVGKPIVVPVEMDEVKPHVGPGRPNTSNRHPGANTVNSKTPTLQVGSGVMVSGEDSGGDKKGILQPNGQTAQTKPLIVRRPPFRPRPNVPIVRIDTCIVGDDSTCEAALNEKCLTELGLSSCQCRPGYSRSQARTPCVPIIALALSLKVDRMADKKLVFNRNLLNTDTEEYQYLEYESLQAINSIFLASKLSKVYLGTKINRFYSVAGKTIINASINLELNNATSNPSIKRYVQQDLTRVIAVRNNNIGDSQLWVDGSLNAIPRVDDLNECSNNELNDCSKHAKCFNDFGTFRCECEQGYEDKFINDKLKSGRICQTCSPQYCSNKGECFIVNGQRECKCKANFIGSKCDIDAEVLGVALGGSVAALIIIIITFLCLYMWNQRWKKEQQKMEAMSAASGHTFSYVNKQAATAYRLTIDDRMRWAQIAEAMATNPTYTTNYYVNPEQMSSSHSQHHMNHVYATPNRVSSSGTLLNDDLCAYESRQYSRSLRPKSRTASSTHGYSSKNTVNDSIYNETEFSTREMIYSPQHIMPAPAPRSQFSYS
ncbi:uncharacterized protein LOC128960243 [Oppia nitens]|uniref:uncharacterized protein LOC128960243 n=1 Tax=Oppia nitens TaxID=1686743 RepID=UPI0023DC020C|nr:uncharacterized protein LOC128960243 [Oppia nitens]